MGNRLVHFELVVLFEVMRPPRFSALFVLLVAGFSAREASAQDFDPHGRRRPKPPTHKPNPGNPPTGKKPPAGTDTPGKEHGDAAQLIDRYTKIVLAQPGATFPLQRLTQLYRERDGNIKALLVDFEQRAGATSPEQYAAAVTLAGLYRVDGRMDEATKTYERAITLKPNDPSAMLSLARLYQDRGETKDAKKSYEQALPHQSVPADREQTLRALMSLSLDEKDWAAAKGFHKELVKLQPTSLFVRAELGKELFSRAEYERSESEFREVVQASQGDNRTLAPALADLGRALAKAHKAEEALTVLKRALAASGSEAAVRKEIYETITEVYRADQKLPAFIKELEAEHPSDFLRLSILAALYEETGDIAAALKLYQRALAISPKQIDLRLKVIRLLQAQGELDRAVAEYDGLIRSAPNNPEFVFEQCEALIQRGERGRAEKLLLQLEARAQGDEEVLSRLADYYARIGLNEKSTHVLQRLTQLAGSDPSHLVELGDRYFQDGNQNLARETWKRILVSVTPRARALSAYGEVLLEHELIVDAISALREASQLEPQNLVHKKNLAAAFEHSRNYDDSTALWTELLEKAKAANDRSLAREARSHLVAMWGFQKKLEGQIPVLEKKLAATPRDLEAGRLLAEIQLHQRHFPEAEATLRIVVDNAPGDGESYLALERVLVQQNKLQEAIAVLEKLVAAEPKRARELYQRMAQYALSLYHDDDAIKYSARAVALNPDDAEGHRRLGEMYRSRQDIPHAISEFRTAIIKTIGFFRSILSWPSFSCHARKSTKRIASFGESCGALQTTSSSPKPPASLCR